MTQRPKVQIKLHQKDEDHLIKWHNAINSCNRLSTIDGRFKQSSHYSKKMCNDLIKLGCVPNKSLLLKFPTIPKYLQSHLIRGYFDGDGCVSFSIYRKISFVGTKDFLQKIRKILGLNGYFGATGKAYNWGVHGTKVTQKIIDYMYENATVYLERKREKCYG